MSIRISTVWILECLAQDIPGQCICAHGAECALAPARERVEACEDLAEPHRVLRWGSVIIDGACATLKH